MPPTLRGDELSEMDLDVKMMRARVRDEAPSTVADLVRRIDALEAKVFGEGHEPEDQLASGFGGFRRRGKKAS